MDLFASGNFDPRDQGADPRVVDTKESVEDALLDRPGVYGVGVHRRDDGVECIKVWVEPGLDVAGLRLPERVQDVPVIVRVAERPLTSAVTSAEVDRRREMQRQKDYNSYDPLLGGISISGTGEDDYGGTLGVVIADRNSDNRGNPVMLTNNHVLDLRKGDPVTQPAYGNSVTDKVGEFICGTRGRFLVDVDDLRPTYFGVDVAIASIDVPGNRTFQLNAIHELVGDVAEPLAPVRDMAVTKRGMATLVTTGIITDVNVTYLADGYRLDNQFTVKEEEGAPVFAEHGDSGSVVVQKVGTDLHPVGLLWGAVQGECWATPYWVIEYYVKEAER